MNLETKKKTITTTKKPQHSSPECTDLVLQVTKAMREGLGRMQSHTGMYVMQGHY